MTESALRAEHALVASNIAECREALEGEFTWDAARRAVIRLREELEKHFELEERGGYLDEVLARAPEHAKAVADLLGEHNRMRGELATLLACVLVARSRGDARHELDRLLDGLAVHERREHELVQLALAVDVGSGD